MKVKREKEKEKERAVAITKKEKKRKKVDEFDVCDCMKNKMNPIQMSCNIYLSPFCMCI